MPPNINTKLQSSFIPKKPISQAPLRRAASINIFLLLSVLLLIVTAAVAGGIYFYDQSLTKKITTNDTTIAKAIREFGSKPDDFIILGNRIETAKTILQDHAAVSLAFKALEELTARNVRFSKFDYNLKGTDSATISLSGEARGKNAVVFQSDLFRGVNGPDTFISQIKNPIFSNIRIDEKVGLVFFTVDGTINKTDILYKNIFPADTGADDDSTDTDTATSSGSGTASSSPFN